MRHTTETCRRARYAGTWYPPGRSSLRWDRPPACRAPLL